jgi:predicted transposase/invertase (TIGR01784 family)
VQAVFADPKTDFVFKRIFGAEGRKPLLISLLNHLLELEGARQIRDVEHLPSEQHVDVAELKLSIVDVKCTDETGRRFVVEMQVLNVEGFEKRVVYNASKAYVMQLRNAEEYPVLCDVVGVTWCNFILWPDQNEDGSSKVPMLSRWRMQEQHGGERGRPQVQYVFLELPKYLAGHEPVSLVDKWAYFFREAKHLDVIPEALAAAPFRDALDVARATTFSPTEWDAYERSKMAEQDARGALSLARLEGEVVGQARGKAEALLLVLTARGLPITPEERQTILACTEPSTFDRWLHEALSVRSVSDLLR